MKTTLLTLSAVIVIAMACNRPAKDLADVEIGMHRDSVLGMLGEPKKKDVINATEVWNYTDSSRTIVFRSDTVYAVMTSPEARLDSVSKWLGHTNEKVKDGFGNVGEQLESVAGKVKHTLKKDSSASD